jgi:hypothetical protein
MPRRSNVRVIEDALVAGKAEQMASIVDELVNRTAVDEGSGTLFCANKIDQEQHQQTAK